ncbi:putative serine/threonine-protein kinase fhkE [Grifola frondosa]|uniref:Putative serine/threonine-protein kinase fhkE n=1 Tax=Grifola frondosa TaxID=5627 RepID=A0A1C7MPZ5_GRIFR|nr:putative serine/threonine-protein kinase fhkE [Grifola frondosa]
MIDTPSGASSIDGEQQTQLEESDQANNSTNDSRWGILIPFSSRGSRVDFEKKFRNYKLGRAHIEDQDFITLRGTKISSLHCEIAWDGVDSPSSVVTVTDYSRNGTYINRVCIGNGKQARLCHGDEIVFGSYTNSETEEYCFLYRHSAACSPHNGFLRDYRVCGEIGKGGYGTVVKAYHHMERLWYAVKIIPPDSARDGSASSKNILITREIRIMEQLKHANICRLKETFFERDGVNPFILNGEQMDLRAIICNRRVDWKVLHESGVSSDAEDFTRRLLEVNSEERMTFSMAQKHPWLVQVSQARDLRAVASQSSALALNPSALNGSIFAALGPASAHQSQASTLMYIPGAFYNSSLVFHGEGEVSPQPDTNEETAVGLLLQSGGGNEGERKRMVTFISKYRYFM